MPKDVKQSRKEPDRRQRQLDAIERLATMEPLPAPGSLADWNREYSRLKVDEAVGRLPLVDEDG